jgi:DeoR family glycerol-3-phosphate regulon repressor
MIPDGRRLERQPFPFGASDGDGCQGAGRCAIRDLAPARAVALSLAFHLKETKLNESGGGVATRRAMKRGASAMQSALRKTAILELARKDGIVRVDELAIQFAVSPQSIRKDVNQLCAERLLARVHGGAVLASGTENMEYEQRRAMASDAKAAIGRAAAALIPDGASLFINIGTTTEAVSAALVKHRKLMVITNNINVANRLRVHAQFEVIIASGVVRPSDGGIVGEAAGDFIRQFRVDYAVIGASAIARDGALLDFDYREVKVAQAIIDNARHVILVADHSKFERTAPVRIAWLGQVDSFVTDSLPHADVRRICTEHEVRLIEVASQN